MHTWKVSFQHPCNQDVIGWGLTSQTCWQISSLGHILVSQRALDFQKGSKIRPLNLTSRVVSASAVAQHVLVGHLWSERTVLITGRTYGVTNRNKQHVLLVWVKGGCSWHWGSNLFSRYTEQSGWGRLCVCGKRHFRMLLATCHLFVWRQRPWKKLGVSCWNRAPF